MKYSVRIYPVGTTSRPVVEIGNDERYQTYLLKSCYFSGSILEPVTYAGVEFTRRSYDPKDSASYLYGPIMDGDIAIITEQESPGDLGRYTTPPVGRTAYVGRIIFHKSTYDSNRGTIGTLVLSNLLGQWDVQAAINNIDQQLNQGLTNLNSNQIPFGQTLAQAVQGSYFQLLLSQGVLTPYGSYNGVQIPVNTAIPFDQKIWTYAAVNMSKLEVLQMSLFPYQKVIYQNPDGTVAVANLSAATKADPTYAFSQSNNFPSAGEQGNAMQVEVVHGSANLPNRLVSCLFNIPFFPPETNGNPEFQNFIASVDNPIPRAKELLNSGYGMLQYVRTDALSNAMLQDPTILTFLQASQTKTAGYILNTLQGATTIAGTYATRYLAIQNIKATTVTITVPRSGTLNVDLPIGKMVSMDFPGFLGPDESQLYCYGYTITHETRPVGTKLTLNLCRPYCITSFWD